MRETFQLRHAALPDSFTRLIFQHFVSHFFLSYWNKSIRTFYVSLEKHILPWNRFSDPQIRGTTLQIIIHNNKKVRLTLPDFPGTPAEQLGLIEFTRWQKKSTSNPPYWTIEQRNRYAINPFI